MTILFVLLYFALGLVSIVYLSATADGFSSRRQKAVDKAAYVFSFLPELGILILALWPLYVVARIFRQVSK